MAEFAALGAAASVLQVVDFGTRFIVTAWQTSRSDNTPPDLQSFSLNFQDLQDSSAKLQVVQHELQTMSARPGSDTAINSLAAKSAVLSKEMLDSLEQIGRADQGRKRDAVKKAWLMHWKEDKLQSLETRLKDVKADLTLFLTINLRTTARATLDNQEQILSEMRTMRSDIKDLGRTTSGQYDTQAGFGFSVLELLTSGLYQHQQIKAELVGALIADIYRSEGRSGLPDSSSIQLPEHRRDRLERLFVQKLRYDSMQERELTIKNAHEGTFRWIFEGNDAASRSTIGFKEWLESEDTIYWITGKPGSGKSTLMRYILQPTSQTVGGDDETNVVIPRSRCEEHLRHWAGSEQKLTIASFHFWAIGSKIQASQEGLFRTLLVQLLGAHPEIIPMVSPSRWESLCLLGEDPKGFSQDELGAMFRQAAIQISTRAKLALFIDGLDEFDGDCNSLLATIKECVTSPIKICISSRPWTEFEDAFGLCPRLRMEDLTYPDILNYIIDKVEEDSQFKRLQRRQPEFADNLIQSVAEKASGVFLWVTIVVASLLAGMGSGDRIEDLEKRLDLLPVGIRELYERILESIDPIYLEHAAQLFKLMDAYTGTPSLMLLWYADEVRFLDKVISENPKTVSREETLERLEDMRRRINSRCKGLLEVQQIASPDMPNPEFERRVWYLHKTVSEFIRSDSAQQRLRGYPKAPFDACLRISAACAALAKLHLQLVTASDPDKSDFYECVSECLDYAAAADEESSSEVVRLVDHLRDECGVSYDPDLVVTSSFSTLFQSIWKSAYFSLDQKFLCLATAKLIVGYVRVKAASGGLVTANCTPKDSYRKRFFSSISQKLLRQQEVPTISLLSLVDLSSWNSVSMVKLLLDNGANPNGSHTDIDLFRVSPWEDVLVNAFIDFEQGFSAIHRRRLTECVHLMLDRGAKVSSKTIERVVKLQENRHDGPYFTYRASYQVHKIGVLQRLQQMKRDPGVDFEVSYVDSPT
ncbi:hypothetical protein ACHAPJ_006269 [Fusarium lateritium]